MPTKKPPSSFGKDVLIIGGVFLALAGIGVWLVVYLIQSWQEAPEEIEGTAASDETGENSAAVSQQSQVTAAAKSFALPEDAGKLAGETDFYLAGNGFDSLSLVFTQPRGELVIEVPAGVKVVAVGATELPDFYTLRSVRFEIGPQDFQSGRLNTVMTDHGKLKQPQKTDRLQFVATDREDPVRRFIIQAEKDGLEWGSVQSGVWMLTENISPENFGAIRVTLTTPGYSSNRQQTIVANYEGLKKTSNTFRKLGWSLEQFQLLVHHEAKFRAVLKEVDFDKPGKNNSSILTNKSLLEYQIEPEVEGVLLRYMVEHPQAYIRLAALKNLVAIDIRQSADSLFSALGRERNWRRAFLAANRLFRLEDDRSLPLLAAFEKDPDLRSLFQNNLARRIRKISGKNQQSGENLLSFWTRTVGWGSLNEHGEAVRQVVETLLEIPDPLLAEALQNVSSAEYKTVNAALNQLKKYPENRTAFDALVKLGSGHREDNIRFSATGILSRFGTFDLREFCEGRLKRDSDYRVGQSVINLAARQKFPGFEEVILLGCRNRHPQVREWAAGAVGSQKISQGTSTLLNMAQRDSEKKVRRRALRALSELKSYDVLAVLRTLLRSSDSEDKWTALNTLRLWESNPDALDLLEPYRKDSTIGTAVVKYLTKYGR